MPTQNSWNNQVLNANVTFNGGTMSIGTDNATNAITIGTGTSSRSINIGRSAAAHTIVFGNTNTTTSVDIASGTGNMILNSAGTNSLTGTGGVTITSQNTAMSLLSGTGTLSVSADAAATTLNIGTGAAVKTVTIGSTNTTSVTTVACGTGGANFGTSANAHTTVVGSTTAASTTTIQAPSAGVILTGVQGVAVANKNYVTINTATGAIGSDAGPASSISITGDTGGALTGNSFTFTGGTTGLSFGGSGSTETLTFAGITANGGTVSLATDATASTINVGTGAGAKTSTFGSTNTTSTTVIKSGSGNVTVNSGLTVDSTGRMFNTVQPAFFATQNGIVSNVTGDGTSYTIIFDLETFDQGSVFNTGTGTFTAPITGKYYISANVLLLDVIAANTVTLTIVTSNRTIIFGNTGAAFAGNFPIGTSFLTDFDAADTATVVITVAGGAKIADVYGVSTSDPRTNFSGYLAC